MIEATSFNRAHPYHTSSAALGISSSSTIVSRLYTIFWGKGSIWFFSQPPISKYGEKIKLLKYLLRRLQKRNG